MSKQLRPFLLFLVLLLVVPIFAQDDDGPQVALFLPLGNNEYVRNAEAGARGIIEAAGGSLTTFTVEFDAEAQINQMQDAITSGNFDAFIVYSVDNIAVIVGVEAAAAAGIPVIALDAPINEDRKTLVPHPAVAGQIARTGEGDGEQIGRAIVMACEDVDPCEVAFISGFEGFPLDQDRLEAIEGEIAPHPHISIVTVQYAFYLEDEGFNVATDMLIANPDIDVFASVGDQSILGAELAVQDAGLEDQIKLIGNGASLDGYNAVKEGRWFATVANIPITNGQIAAQMALQALSGDLIIRSVNMYDQSPPIPASGAVITQDVIDEFEPQW